MPHGGLHVGVSKPPMRRFKKPGESGYCAIHHPIYCEAESVSPIHKQLDCRTGSRVHTVFVNSNHMRSGELARLTGVSPDTLRYYEKLGILPPSRRTNGGYRMFPPSSVERVRLAQRALQLGFSLSELSEILRSCDNGGVPCHRVLNLAEEKLRSISQQIGKLRQTQAYMRKLLREWRRKLKNTPPGSRALLLHSLMDRPRTKNNNLKRRSP